MDFSTLLALLAETAGKPAKFVTIVSLISQFVVVYSHVQIDTLHYFCEWDNKIHLKS